MDADANLRSPEPVHTTGRPSLVDHPACSAGGDGVLRWRCASVSRPRSEGPRAVRARGGWVLVHIAAGAVALLTGPVQLWLGVNRRAMPRAPAARTCVRHERGNQLRRRVLPGGAHHPGMGVRIRHHGPRHRLAGDDHAGRRGDPPRLHPSNTGSG